MTPPKRQTIDTRRPADFHESLAPVLPSPAPASALPAIHLPSGTLRYVIAALWVLAAIAAGAGIGALMISTRAGSAVTAELPLPVATAQVKVAPAPAAATVRLARTSEPQSLAVKTNVAVTQAQAGNPFAVASVAFYQPFASADSLQPGFTRYGLAQGAQGTDPVR
jgi:hypothetical protein